MSDWKGSNRRRFPRLNYPCLVVINEDLECQGEAFLTHTENIGVGGIGIALKKGLRLSSFVQLELDLLDLHDHICCKGRVAWSLQRKETNSSKPLFYDIGIEFIDVKPEQQKQLEAVLHRLAASLKNSSLTKNIKD